jgi:hypothetical protein
MHGVTMKIKKIKIHILRSITFPEIRAAYEMTWQYTVQLARPQMTIKHGACVWLVPMNKGYRHTDGIIQYCLLLHCNNGYVNAPRYYVVLHCLSCLFLPRTKNIVHFCPKDTYARWQVLKNNLIFQDDYGSYKQQASQRNVYFKIHA